MRKLKLALVAALVVPTYSVLAEEAESDHSVSYNMALHSEYIFRGYTQTHNDPALSGGADYEHSSGLYLGLWASNISWLRDADQSDSGHSLEVDVYGGYANEIGETGIGYDVGFLQYFYPGELKNDQASANTLELYAGLSYEDLSATYYQVVSDDAWTWGKTMGTGDSAKGTWYLSLDYDHDVGQYLNIDGLSASLHYGRQEFDGTANEAYDYSDYLVGLDKEFMGLNVGYNFTTTNQSKTTWGKVDGKYLGETRHVFYVAKEF
ncbi:MAG: TorF family putative porin [Paracoccaceae bacterium]